MIGIIHCLSGAQRQHPPTVLTVFSRNIQFLVAVFGEVEPVREISFRLHAAGDNQAVGVATVELMMFVVREWAKSEVVTLRKAGAGDAGQRVAVGIDDLEAVSRRATPCGGKGEEGEAAYRQSSPDRLGFDMDLR